MRCLSAEGPKRAFSPAKCEVRDTSVTPNGSLNERPVLGAVSSTGTGEDGRLAEWAVLAESRRSAFEKLNRESGRVLRRWKSLEAHFVLQPA